MSELNCKIRRKQFIDEIVALCLRNRVLIEYYEDDDSFSFVECAKESYTFLVEMADMEEAVRLGCFNELHGIKKDE